MDVNLNLIDTGEAPIDTGYEPFSGRFEVESNLWPG